jgi:hypothetical protein
LPLCNRRQAGHSSARALLAAVPAQAQTVTLRLRQFLPPQAVMLAKVTIPWEVAPSVKLTERAAEARVLVSHCNK